MAVSREDVQRALPGLVDSDAAEQARLDAEVDKLIAAAGDLVEVYLRGGECPEGVQHHAILRLLRFLYCTPGEAGGSLKLDGIERATSGVGDPMHKSGAAQMLARYRGVRVVTARADTDD